MTSSPTGISRRAFLQSGTSCAAHIVLLTHSFPRAVWGIDPGPQGYRVVAREPWASIVQLSDGIWAVVSTPLEDRTTLCNGGIVAGTAGTVVVDGYANDAGSAWVAGWARELTGRWPTDVVLSHYHGDHSNGLTGYVRDGETPRFHGTAVTRDLVAERYADRNASAGRRALLSGIVPLAPENVTDLDLGGRVVRIVPRAGHTPSDVTVEVTDPSVVFGGDLLWNGMFPNYMDATPSILSRDVRAMIRERETVYVPGHGPLADGRDVGRYVSLLDDVEAAARRAVERGVTAAEAAQTYRPSESLGEWMLFSPRYYQVALGAWERELVPR